MVNGGKERSVCKREGWKRGGGSGGGVWERAFLFLFFDLPGHEVPSWGCWGCVGGAVRGGTAESRVVPLRKKSDIREGRGQQGGEGQGRGGGLHLQEVCW